MHILMGSILQLNSYIASIDHVPVSYMDHCQVGALFHVDGNVISSQIKTALLTFLDQHPEGFSIEISPIPKQFKFTYTKRYVSTNKKQN